MLYHIFILLSEAIESVTETSGIQPNATKSETYKVTRIETKKNKLALPLVSKSEKFKVVYSFSALAINPFSKNKSLSGARRTPHVC